MAYLLFFPGFLLAVFSVLLIDYLIGRRVDPALRQAAEASDAWPIATIRGRRCAKVVLLHGHEGESESAFLVLEDGGPTRIAAEEIRRLWTMGRLRWYRPNGRLGMRQFFWYTDAHPGELKPDVLDQPAPRWVIVAFVGVACVLAIAVACLFALELGWGR